MQADHGGESELGEATNMGAAPLCFPFFSFGLARWLSPDCGEAQRHQWLKLEQKQSDDGQRNQKKGSQQG